MKKVTPAASPDAYVAALSGWRRDLVQSVRGAVLGSGKLTETIKWGNVLFAANGPVLVIRAEPTRVLISFWRGQRLRNLEPRLKPGGKYEMATLQLTRDTELELATVRKLTRAAVRLNVELGDPTSGAVRA